MKLTLTSNKYTKSKKEIFEIDYNCEISIGKYSKKTLGWVKANNSGYYDWDEERRYN